MQNSIRVKANGDSGGDGCGGGRKLCRDAARAEVKSLTSREECRLLLYSLSGVSDKQAIQESLQF